jgi:tripartite-type tricarboxylate transporter receptor subunit TctC
VRLLTLALAGAVLGTPVAAQTYPDRPIQLIVPYAAGAATDLVARTLTETMARGLGQQFVVVNRDGASATIGAAAIAQARADGYTLGYTAIGPITIQPHLMSGLSFLPDSFQAICQTSELPFALAVKQDSPWKSLADIVAAAKREPDKLGFAVTGTNTIPHLAMIEFQLLAGIRLVHVAYRGESVFLGPVMAGEVPMAVVTIGFGLNQNLRLLGTFTEKRTAEAPDVPTFAELGHRVVQTVPSGLVAPKGIDARIVARLEAACAEAVRSERYAELSRTTRQPVAFRGAADFQKAIADDFIAKRELLQKAGMKTP